jgi:ribosome biogenesis protein MAK21
LEPRPDWHAVELPELPTIEKPATPPRNVIEELHQYADTLLENENNEYTSSNMSSSSSHKFMQTIMSSGTLEDRVSALTLLVQESPVHNMKAFENLLSLAEKRNRNQAIMALGALKDLLGQGVVLPPDRRLRSFNKQPGLVCALQGKNIKWDSSNPSELPGSLQKAHLISWAYEDWLKRKYFDMLRLLEQWCNDEVEYSRNRCVTFVYELLREKPEQEENLLRLLINKLGDPDKKIASRASYLLLQLQNKHPLMKGIIIDAIQTEYLFKPGQSDHAKYYAVITLNQTVLSVKETEVANKLLDIYFKLFIGLIQKKKSAEIVDGRNVKGEVQGGGGKPGKRAREKAKRRETESKGDIESAEKIISQILSGINRAFPFGKTEDASFIEQIDMIFKVTHASNFNTSLQALTLLQQISATKHVSSDRYYRTLYESLLDPRLVNSSKHILYLNLLYKSLKADVSVKRVQAFVKRLLQIITLHEPPFACGVLFLVTELATEFPAIKTMLSTPEANDEEDGDTFQDAQEDSRANTANTNTEVVNGSTKIRYDARKRDPEYSNADTSCLWELLPFTSHFHPSVSLFASRLLTGGEKPPKPDPTSHTLMHFLDRFAYRNPKTNPNATKGSSIMQPMAGADTADRLVKTRDGGRKANPLNSEEFWTRKLEQVAPEDVVFHQYFNVANKKKEKLAKKKEKGKNKDEESEEGSVADEEEIWKVLVSSKPDVEDVGSEDGEGFDEDELENMTSDEDGDLEDDDIVTEEGIHEDDEGVILDLESDDGDGELEEEQGTGGDTQESDDDFPDFDAGEFEDDEDALLGSDDDVPSDFEFLESLKPKAGYERLTGKEKRAKKRKLKSLPTFASVEDYARLIGDDDDDS